MIKKVKWEEVKAFDLDYPYDEYCFSIRLAYKNKWSENFTIRAIEEYKKFMFLATISDKMVSPSEIIDIVWHQHLIFTKSYSQFCDLLGKKIEHIPSTNNTEDQPRFRQAKIHANKLYEEHFGEQDTEIWSATTMYDSLKLEKAKFKIRSLIVIGLLSVVVLLFPLFFALRELYKFIPNPDFVLVYSLLSVGLLILLRTFNQKKIKNLIVGLNRNSFIFDLKAYEVSFLKFEDESLLIHGFVNNCVINDQLEVANKFLKPGTEKKNHENFFTKVITDLIQRFKQSPYPLLHNHLRVKPVFQSVKRSMSELKKFFLKSTFFFKLFLINFLPCLFLFVLGFERILIGISKDKPIAIIGVVMLFYCIGAIIHLNSVKDLFTKIYLPLYYRETKTKVLPEVLNWDWGFFILETINYDPTFKPLVSSLDYQGNSSGSSSCGSGCGSSCSSCGGCGGCGGD